MSKLESIYLMNVSLYLDLDSIPNFVQINTKTKEAINLQAPFQRGLF